MGLAALTLLLALAPEDVRHALLTPARAWSWLRACAAAVFALVACLVLVPVRARKRAGPWGPPWLAHFVARLLSASANAMGVHYDVEWPACEIVADQPHVVVWHPHGALAFCALSIGGLLSLERQPIRWYPVVASVIFRFPLLREVVLLLGGREATKETISAIIEAGHSVGVQPGGIFEQLRTSHAREHAFFPPNLTFVRLAIEHGTPLLPVYLFGENQLFSTRPALQRLARFIRRWTGVPLIIPFGRWGLPWIVPRRTRVRIRFGRPVPVGPACARPSDEAVDAVFARYSAELHRLFDEGKSTLPADVAARGLTIVRRTRPERARR